jgi:hypothetical protein
MFRERENLGGSVKAPTFPNLSGWQAFWER